MDPLPHKPWVWRARYNISSLHDAHRTFTTFIVGENSATVLGIKSEITSQGFGPEGAWVLGRRTQSPMSHKRCKNNLGLNTGH